MSLLEITAKAAVMMLVTLSLASIAEASEYIMTKNSVDRCEPRILRAPTRFPEKAQSSGAGGEVRVKVLLGARVLESRLARSSGYAVLDRAAIDSVREDWEFDISHCNASSLPISAVVSINYVRVPITVSFGVERRRNATMTMAVSNDRCTVTPGRKEQLTACIQ
jgi:TonB family protein